MQELALPARADGPHPGLPPPWAESCAARLAAVLLLLPLTDVEVRTVNGPSQRDSFPLTVSSPDLPAGRFPREFTCDGANRLPRLQWSTPPSGTQELVIEMLDPDAPGGTFTHWLAYGLPPGISSLPAVPANAAEAVNDFGRRGYGARARRGARRIATTWWSWRWAPGWIWQPERPGRSWSRGSPVTCLAGANWSRPTSAADRVPARAASPVACLQDTVMFTLTSAGVHLLFIFGVNLGG